MFCGVLAVFIRPGDFFFRIFPVVNPPENRILAGNGIMASKLKVNAKNPLRCRDRLIISRIRIISKHKIFYHPLLHGYWYGIIYRVQWPFFLLQKNTATRVLAIAKTSGSFRSPCLSVIIASTPLNPNILFSVINLCWLLGQFIELLKLLRKWILYFILYFLNK